MLVNLGTCVHLVKSICATSRPTPSGWHDCRILELSPTLIAALCNHLPIIPSTSRGCQACSSNPAADELTTSQVHPFCLRPWNCSHLCEPTCGFCHESYHQALGPHRDRPIPLAREDIRTLEDLVMSPMSALFEVTLNRFIKLSSGAIMSRPFSLGTHSCQTSS